ncbi:unnamed protein product [Allacma fusca]|uniref:Uncharacterized protein n=1 Tax=Allacma fusca TaxID=39272 RepID=A0A8J2KAX0_9HEXA|nr:unnamed protein product [Allacma fusca]
MYSFSVVGLTVVHSPLNQNQFKEGIARLECLQQGSLLSPGRDIHPSKSLSIPSGRFQDNQLLVFHQTFSVI